MRPTVRRSVVSINMLNNDQFCVNCLSEFRLAFKPEELREALLPTLEKLVAQEPESVPFRMPVDPTTLGIPDYFDIVRKPMDLSTIRKKLDSGQYSDPWEYVDDVWLMFDNAWLYNRKTSRVYRYCTKVSAKSHSTHESCANIDVTFCRPF